jgi:deoxyribodipyrimidine photo-lyase
MFAGRSLAAGGAAPMSPTFLPTRAEGLARLDAFLPRAGTAYAARRNEDLPGHPHVSTLSPWIRHRLVTEAEVLAAASARHGAAADKFLSEVWWRTYWKGWLEMRPSVWAGYRRGVAGALDRLAVEAGLRQRWEEACLGRTGIEGFDDWAHELVATGYLHNHARMWFASIWTFTLRLPWELGADFFLRHLLDGDPASNTLSWRWVAGLHTPGKTYLATAENIARNTGGRFRPRGLAGSAPAPAFSPPRPERAAPGGEVAAAGVPALLLLTEEDLSPAALIRGLPVAGVAVLSDVAGRSPLAVAPGVAGFVAGAVEDALARMGAPGAARFGPGEGAAVVAVARACGAGQIVTAHAPVGPVAEALEGVAAAARAGGLGVARLLAPHDRAAWPQATGGFFRFREAVMGRPAGGAVA